MATMDNFLRQTAADQDVVSRNNACPDTPPAVDGYRTGRLLGTGGNANVWLLEERQTGVARALKVFPAYAPGGEHGRNTSNELLAQLRRESTVLGSLEHPHLLGLHAVVSTDQGPGLMTDYAAGGSLLNLVTARGRLSPGECITVLAPIAQAVAHLHSSSVHHGDLSPGNVLFTAEGKPLIGDLGAARLLGEKYLGAAGTAGFSETRSGEIGPPAAAADVYSLAALGWYSLTGNPPGQTKDRVPLSLLVPEVSSELLQILESGLETEWTARPSAAEFAETVLRSGVPRPLDLVAAVHPSVLPQLLTRRPADIPATAPRPRLAAVLGSLRPGKATSRRKKRARLAEPRGRRRRQPDRPEPKWKSAVPQTTAAVLVLLGSMMAGQHFLGGISTGTSEPDPAPLTVGIASSQGVEESGAKAQQGEGTERETAPAAPAPASVLSAEMQARLSDADPAKVLPALAGVRAMALTSADTDLLSHVNIRASEAMDADRVLVAGLQEQGLVFSGLSIRVEGAFLTDALEIPEGAAAVTATVVMSGYSETDTSGSPVRTVPDSTPQELVFVLMKEADVWKIDSVHTAGAV